MNISGPFNVAHGTASTSPIVRMDAKARSKVNWSAASLIQKTHAVFEAFIEVFHENHWRYAAGSFPGQQTIPILLGQQTMQQLEAQFGMAASMDCGRIRNLLAIAMQALLPVTVGDARVTGLFITKPMGALPPGVQGSFTCIDPNVYGNVRTTTAPCQLVRQCIFEDHYAVKVNETALIYDGCLVATYTDINVVVGTLLKKSPADPNVLIPRTPPPIGGPRVVQYQAMKNESPSGFSTGYMRL
jgi:hypothetical protein